MKPFEYYAKTEDVKKVSPDKDLAKSLIKDMQDRINKVSKLDVNVFSKIVFENVYDAIRDFCDALLTLDGFKSYSHQAAIAYLTKYKFDEPTLGELDQYRIKRNDSKYYGYSVVPKEAQEIMSFYKEIKPKIDEVLKEKGIK